MDRPWKKCGIPLSTPYKHNGSTERVVEEWKGEEKIFKEILAENFPNLLKDDNL